MRFQPLILILFIISCNEHEKEVGNTIVIHDTVHINNLNDWQKGFGLTHEPDKDSIGGKPINFYINNKNCSPIAIDFYYGSFKPTDNNTTAALLSLVTTDDKTLRPFYRWCLSKTISIQDGALVEYTGEPARNYAQNFPKEFFEYMDLDSTKERYNEWLVSIKYSLPNGTNYNVAKDSLKLIKEMKSHCINCDGQLIDRIKKFANDCFSE